MSFPAVFLVCNTACRRWIPPVGSSYREGVVASSEVKNTIGRQQISALTMANWPIMDGVLVLLGICYISWKSILTKCNKTVILIVCNKSYCAFVPNSNHYKATQDNKEHPLVQYDALCAFLLKRKILLCTVADSTTLDSASLEPTINKSPFFILTCSGTLVGWQLS